MEISIDITFKLVTKFNTHTVIRYLLAYFLYIELKWNLTL